MLSLILPDLVIVRLPISAVLLALRFFRYDMQPFSVPCTRDGLKTSSDSTGCSYYLSECMEKHLPRFLEKGMTAIICSQDTLANSALIQCQQLGYRIPEDINIIGFDDIPIAAYTSPPLTTIRQDRPNSEKAGSLHYQAYLITFQSAHFYCMHS